MKTKKFFQVAVALGLLAVCFVSAASAKDDIVATVTALTGPSPLIVNNGQATGTIHVRYTHIGFTFPSPGVFASVTLNLAAQAGSGGKGNATTYPVPLNLTQQQGPGHLVIAPAPASFSVTSNSWSGSSAVTVSIPSGTLPSTDGAEVNGVLQLSTTPQNELRTPTTVIFFITLVHPTSCLKLYDFITEWGGSNTLSTVRVRIKQGEVHDTQPGLLSDNILVVNTCSSTQYFDLKAIMDPRFTLTPDGNPGNAVFTYTVQGSQDNTTFNLTVFGTGAGQGQNLCLANRQLSAGYMFLVTAKMKIGITDPAALTSAFAYSAELRTATTPPTTACSGSLHGLASPNPATTSLPFTTCTLGGPSATCPNGN